MHQLIYLRMIHNIIYERPYRLKTQCYVAYIALDNNCTWISITSVGASSTYDGVPIFDTYTFSKVDSKGDNVYVTKPKEEWLLHKDNQNNWVVSPLYPMI